jgi:hypothetical protein
MTRKLSRRFKGDERGGSSIPRDVRALSMTQSSAKLNLA